MKIFFKNDYSQGAHPRIFQSLNAMSQEDNDGYGLDKYSQQAAKIIQEKTGQDCDVHFLSGGTQANIVNISHMLRPYESIIACNTSHVALHEAGAIEATGHKLNLVKNKDGKLRVSDIQNLVNCHDPDHMVIFRAVFISQTTEYGSIYSKQELLDISACCRRNNLYLYIDGARLGHALTSPHADFTLSDIASVADMFYIGGTKNGALCGEATVIVNSDLKKNYRYSMKQRGALLAKGALLGCQFLELFKDDLYFDLASHANAMAQDLTNALKAKGILFQSTPQSNQIFPILPVPLVETLEESFSFYRWEPEVNGEVCLRLVTSWATTEDDVKRFTKALNTQV